MKHREGTRAAFSRGIVKWVSGLLNSAYWCNCYGPKWLEHVFAYIAGKGMRYLFPIAEWVDKEEMVTQMIEESWWG